jgi:hypothetical protein
VLASVDPATVTLIAFVDAFAVWEGKTPYGHAVSALLPALLPDAPELARTAWVARAVALMTGRCRLCDATASATDDGIDVAHHEQCPAGGDFVERWMRAADV